MASVLQRVRLLLGYTLRWNIAKGAIVVVSTQPVRDENLEFETVMNKISVIDNLPPPGTTQLNERQQKDRASTLPNTKYTTLQPYVG